MKISRNQHLHFGLFEPDEKLVACVIAVPLSPIEAKIRQMAVSPSRQREGLGQRVMNELEKTCERVVSDTRAELTRISAVDV
jgi:N-acetylglutamate synthase-like GNAT family acetyltransferase